MKHLFIAVLILLVVGACCPSVCQGQDPDDYIINTNYGLISEDPDVYGFLEGGDLPHENWENDDGGIPWCYNHYPLMCTDSVGIMQKELYDYIEESELIPGYVSEWERKLYLSEDVHINLLDDLTPTTVEDGIPHFQIAFNHLTKDDSGVVVKDAMFTVYFPPNFRNVSGYLYPLVIISPGFGTAGINQVVFSRDGSDVTVPNALYLSKKAYLLNGKGVVVVDWNMGGRHCMGVNTGARSALNHFIQEMADLYACDTEKIIAMGGSRGAFGALTIAENTVPINDQGHPGGYTAIAVFANSPPCRLGDLSQNPISTQPIYSGRWASFLDDVNEISASKYSYFNSSGDREPPCLSPKLLARGFENPNLHTPPNPPFSFQKVNELCPDYPANLDQLEGKFVYLSCGTKDGFFPYNYFFEMDQALNSCCSGEGIDHTTFVLLQGTHTGNPNDIRQKIQLEFLRAVFCSMDETGGQTVQDYLEGFGTETFPYSAFNVNDWWNVWEWEEGDPPPLESEHELFPHYTHGQDSAALNYRLLKDIVKFNSGNRDFTDIIPLAEPPFIMTVPAHLGCDVFEDSELSFPDRPLVANEPGVIYFSGAPGTKCTITMTNRVNSGSANVVTINKYFSPGQLTKEIRWWPNCCDLLQDEEGGCLESLCGRMHLEQFPGGLKSLSIENGIIQMGHLDWEVEYGPTAGPLCDYSAFTNWKYDDEDQARVPFRTDIGIKVELAGGGTYIDPTQPYPSRYYFEEDRSDSAASFGVDAIPPAYFAELPEQPTSGSDWFRHLEAKIGHYMPPVPRTYSYDIYVTPVVGPPGDPDPVFSDTISLPFDTETQTTFDLLTQGESGALWSPPSPLVPRDYNVRVDFFDVTDTAPGEPPSARDLFGDDYVVTANFVYTLTAH